MKLEADGVTEVTIEFSELGRGETWSAIVQDPSGAPIDYASVFYHLARTVTDADGRFTCYDLAESGKVTIEHQHYLLREVAWSATSELPEVITLDPGAALEVHIDLRGPKPIPTWINVNLLGARRGQAPGVQVDRSGTAKMYALEPGSARSSAGRRISRFPLRGPSLYVPGTRSLSTSSSTARRGRLRSSSPTARESRSLTPRSPSSGRIQMRRRATGGCTASTPCEPIPTDTHRVRSRSPGSLDDDRGGRIRFPPFRRVPEPHRSAERDPGGPGAVIRMPCRSSLWTRPPRGYNRR